VSLGPADVLRQAVDAFARGDLAAMLALADPEIEIHIPDNPETQYWKGPEQGLEAVGIWSGAFDDYAIDLEEVVERGDRVFAVVLQHGRAQLTGGRVEDRNAYVITVRDGRVTRWEIHGDPADARAAFEESHPAA
jgi:hypothetical protein